MISIIVPVYNTSKYLEKCLQSLLNQTYQNIEIIVIDDGSTDGSLTIAQRVAKKDKRLHVYSKLNGGLSSARNVGLQYAKGEYIGFVDSDDYVENNMFEVLYQMMNNNNAELSICGWYLVEDSNIRTCPFQMETKSVDSKEAIDILLNHVSYDNFACNKLFKRKLFESITFPEGKLLEDLLTIYKLINQANTIVISSTPLYYYVLHNNSITSNLHKQINPDAFNSFIVRKNDLLYQYPTLKNKIKSNYFTTCKNFFITSIHSQNRNNQFEKDRIQDMRSNIRYVWLDQSIPFRVKVSSNLIALFPYLYFKVRK